MYDALIAAPAIMVNYVSENKPVFERILAGLPRGLAKCGTKKVKNSDG